ncbi:hypothetical protein ACFXPI_08425 [Streptomyces sp. NPDC059104]|uniref:hypothetical protein n=1 Tax=Streptomyces sp. NPDC059104 TaxID=3346729 RepID=UPI0036AF2E44
MAGAACRSRDWTVRGLGGHGEAALPAAAAVELVHQCALLHAGVTGRTPAARRRPPTRAVFGTTGAGGAAPWVTAALDAFGRATGDAAPAAPGPGLAPAGVRQGAFMGSDAPLEHLAGALPGPAAAAELVALYRLITRRER